MHALRKLRRSKIAVALPITFLILFVSTLGIVAFTYYFSVERVNAQGQILKVSTAKTNMLSLNDAIVETLWQSGASSTYCLTDSGGRLNVLPQNCTLTVTVNATSEIEAVIFAGEVGKVTYELPYQSSSETGLYLKGDERSVTNQSGASLSQVAIENGAEHPEITVRYRPSVTYVVSGEQDGKPVTDVRIYIANLNSSHPISLMGELPLQAVCQQTQLTTQDYQVSLDVEALTVSAVLDGKAGSVSIPIITSPSGGVVHLELVICNISIERWLR